MTQTAPEAPTTEAEASPRVPNGATFGMRLAMIRQLMGWGNVAQAARECGLPTDSWRNWEEGMEPRRLVTVAMAIATKANVDIDWLVYGPVKPGAQPNASYLTVEDVLDPPPHPALEPRVLDRRRRGAGTIRQADGTVRHGDGRRKLPSGQNSVRPAHPQGLRGRATSPVSLPAVA